LALVNICKISKRRGGRGRERGRRGEGEKSAKKVWEGDEVEERKKGRKE
jgi:hypothetical protein